ncbi:hypothetical protein CSIRO_3887 [Bradyrhizobiaceae bacterium SG-6C]|nr:hypothetical protein CSIRO_3887 [Bradyrhizobiaceae bacterium SG-6C]
MTIVGEAASCARSAHPDSIFKQPALKMCVIRPVLYGAGAPKALLHERATARA